MTVALYPRGPTEEQNLDRQLEAIHGYAESTLNVELSETVTYRDKSNGTDTERSGYFELMAGIGGGKHDVVVVNSVSRVARPIRNLEVTADRIREAGAELHILDENLTLQPEHNDPCQAALLRLLGVFA